MAKPKGHLLPEAGPDFLCQSRLLCVPMDPQSCLEETLCLCYGYLPVGLTPSKERGSLKAGLYFPCCIPRGTCIWFIVVAPGPSPRVRTGGMVLKSWLRREHIQGSVFFCPGVLAHSVSTFSCLLLKQPGPLKTPVESEDTAIPKEL